MLTYQFEGNAKKVFKSEGCQFFENFLLWMGPEKGVQSSGQRGVHIGRCFCTFKVYLQFSSLNFIAREKYLTFVQLVLSETGTRSYSPETRTYTEENCFSASLSDISRPLFNKYISKVLAFFYSFLFFVYTLLNQLGRRESCFSQSK